MTYRVTAAGLAVPVWVGLDGKTIAARLAVGQPITAPVRLQGLIDSCSDITAIAPWVFQQLAIPPASSATTQTAAGPIAVRLFEVSLSIDDPGLSGHFLFTQPDMVVMELAAALPDADVLIGLDLLLQGETLLEGPARQFTLDF
jgi:Aspartyl protease